jgi:fatty-acid desaturase
VNKGKKEKKGRDIVAQILASVCTGVSVHMFLHRPYTHRSGA